jgi:hypothetical protein
MVLLASLVMISTGSSCVTTDTVGQAAVARAQVQANVYLTPQPEACRDEMPLVRPKQDEKWRSVQLRWEVVRKNENDTKKLCWELREADAKRLAPAPGSLP